MTKKPKLISKNSILHGSGLFTEAPVDEGICLIEYKGKRNRWSSYKEEVDSDYALLMYIKGGFVIDPRINGNIARFINHSCEPNCEAVTVGKRVYIETLRRIRTGEEITIDYGLSLGTKPTRNDRLRFPCRCGSVKCRGTLLK